MSYTRRNMIKSTASFSTLMFAPKLTTAFAQREAAPHFHLNLFFGESLDSSYLFDARPLSHTAAEKIQNYNGAEPSVWMGQNEQIALAPSYMELLAPFKNDFSIINGVHMAVDSDSHEENIRSLLSGATAGSSLYLAPLNQVQTPLPIDALNTGLFPYQTNGMTDLHSFVKLSAQEASDLQKAIKAAGDERSQDPFQVFVDGRVEALAQKTGMLSKGADRILKSIPGKNSLKSRIANTDLTLDPNAEFSNNLKMIGQYFKQNIAKSAILSESSFNRDTHDSESAKTQPQTYLEVTKKILQVLQFLKETPFDEKAGVSLFDVTTLSVGSEFNRTNRQVENPVSNTGTDHNPLSNMLLLAGKGIRGGQVLGSTDLDQIDDKGSYINVSEAHRSMDLSLIKRMGKPFDFETGRSMDVLPATYQAEHYLTIGSVLNTVYTLFGVPEEKFLTTGRNGKRASILKQLLS